ncbi:hypothetical protein [Lignipirellula cremea]|nr:hypothetical protein [Lignipirellula cremea]
MRGGFSSGGEKVAGGQAKDREDQYLETSKFGFCRLAKKLDAESRLLLGT